MVFQRLINDIIIAETDPLPNIRRAFSDLDAGAVNSKLLLISEKVNKNLEDYVASARLGKIAKATGAKKGELASYYNASIKATGKSWTLNPSEIDIPKYKELLWNGVHEVIDIVGYSITQLSQELGIRLKKDNTAMERCGIKNPRRKKPVLQDSSIVHNKIDNAGGDKV